MLDKQYDIKSIPEWAAILKEDSGDKNQFSEDFFTPEPNKHSSHHRYVTRQENLDACIDPQIFKETQIKRFLRGLTNIPLLGRFFKWWFVSQLKMKLSYFSEEEDKNPIGKIYVKKEQKGLADNANTDPSEFNITHVGHASELINMGGCKTLTDPSFYGLAPVFYPSMTEEVGCDACPDEVPHVIVISHNHRDHTDERSLRELIEKAKSVNKLLPWLFVPKGDAEFFKSLGFSRVKEFEWHKKITAVTKDKRRIAYISVPADHRSGRNGPGGSCSDSHASLVTGWLMSAEDQKEIVYFAGDTARINDVRMSALAVHIYRLYQGKVNRETLTNNELPKIINAEPAGPNYTRKDMEPTHQSVIDSFISPFRLALALHNISEKDNDSISAERWLDATMTMIMHGGKYELGPDRFNEGRFLFIKFIKCLLMTDEELTQFEERQNEKSDSWSLFHRRKDFVVAGVRELRNIAKEIWPEETNINKKLVTYLQNHSRFPLVNQQWNTDELFNNEAETTTQATNKWDKASVILQGFNNKSSGI